VKIPTPRVPTEEEMKITADKWWLHHVGINFIDWNQTMRDNSYPFELIYWSPSLIDETIDIIDSGLASIDHLVDKYTALLAPALEKLNCKNSFFIKTISRSPKDVFDKVDSMGKPIAMTSIRDAVYAIANSMRCFEDMVMLRHLNTAALVVRPFVEFHPKNEWRAIISDRKIMGISQYYYFDEFKELTPEAVKIVDAKVRGFLNDIVIPNMSIGNYIADIIVGEGDTPTIVLETNPYGLSDPCLFKKYGDHMKGQTLWLRNTAILTVEQDKKQI
jgi:hypothetical protein